MQNLIPYVWQMVFANILVKGWIINSDIQSLFYGSQEFWPSLPTISKLSIVTLWPEMTEWSWMGEGVLRCSFKPLCKISCWLTNVFFFTVHPVAFVPIHDPTLFPDCIFVFWGHKEVSDGKSSLKVYLNTISAACSFKVLPQALVIWNNYVWFCWCRLFWPGGFGTSVVVFIYRIFCVLELNSVQAQVGYLHLFKAEG